MIKVSFKQAWWCRVEYPGGRWTCGNHLGLLRHSLHEQVWAQTLLTETRLSSGTKEVREEMSRRVREVGGGQQYIYRKKSTLWYYPGRKAPCTRLTSLTLGIQINEQAHFCLWHEYTTVWDNLSTEGMVGEIWTSSFEGRGLSELTIDLKFYRDSKTSTCGYF